jgi:Family of unknown function (DUF6481)
MCGAGPDLKAGAGRGAPVRRAWNLAAVAQGTPYYAALIAASDRSAADRVTDARRDPLKLLNDFNERLSTVVRARQATLEKFRARPRAADAAVAEQRALSDRRPAGRATPASQPAQQRPRAYRGSGPSSRRRGSPKGHRGSRKGGSGSHLGSQTQGHPRLPVTLRARLGSGNLRSERKCPLPGTWAEGWYRQSSAESVVTMAIGRGRMVPRSSSASRTEGRIAWRRKRSRAITERTGTRCASVRFLPTAAGFLLRRHLLGAIGAESEPLRTVNPNEAEQRSDDCGQLLKAS